MSEPVVVIEHPEPAVAVLRLNRPAVLNALSNAVMDALADGLSAFERDGVTRAVIITGDARAFAAGADVAEFAADGPRLEAWDRSRCRATCSSSPKMRGSASRRST